MRDLKDSRLMWLKAWLFIGLGLLATVLLLNELPTLRIAFLLFLAVWAFCRAYYFVFYVIEHYVDPRYHFSGLWDFAKWWVTKRKEQVETAEKVPYLD